MGAAIFKRQVGRGGQSPIFSPLPGGGYSPGRLRILPNSLSSGSISMRWTPEAAGRWEVAEAVVGPLPVRLGVMGKTGGRVAEVSSSAGSVSGGSGVCPGICQDFRFSSHFT